MLKPYHILTLILLTAITACTHADDATPSSPEPLKLKPLGKIDFPAIVECSGITKSRLWDDIYWVHNDAGNKARIYPIHKNGKIAPPVRYECKLDEFKGIEILEDFFLFKQI